MKEQEKEKLKIATENRNMKPSRKEKLFELALDQPAEKRNAFLDAVCGEDEDLRRDVEALLAEQEQPSVILPQEETTADIPPERSHAEGPGAMIGRYKLLENVGEGGFGAGRGQLCKHYLPESGRQPTHSGVEFIIKRGDLGSRRAAAGLFLARRAGHGLVAGLESRRPASRHLPSEWGHLNLESEESRWCSGKTGVESMMSPHGLKAE